MCDPNPDQNAAAGLPAAADPHPNRAALRRRAEKKARSLEPRDRNAISPEETGRALHELQVHRIELEMQNEELRRAYAELDAARARYFDLFNLAPVGYCTLSEQALILEANLTAGGLLGVARGALVGQSLAHFVLPEDQGIYRRHRKQLFETGLRQVCELRMLRHDGTQFWARMEATAGRDEESGAPVCRSTMSDITERKWAEEELVASKQQMEASNQRLRDTEKGLTIRNRIAEIFLTVPDEEMYGEVLKVVLEVMGSPFGTFGYIDDQGALVVPSMTRDVWDECGIPDKKIVFPREEWGDSSWPRAIREKKTHYTNDPTSNVPHGHVAIRRHIALPIVHQGQVVGLFHVANKETDYTKEDVEFLEVIGRAVASVLDARLRRDEYERERERLLSAIEQAGEAVVITDAKGTIQYVNPAFEAVTGYPRAEAVGQPSRILKSGRQDQGFYRELWETISSGRTWQGRMVNKRKDETLYTEEATISPVRDASGKTVNYVAVKRDITERLNLETQLRQAQKMEAVGRLAGGVAHDFNNMLTIILGLAEIAASDLSPNDPLLPKLQGIQDAGTRAADLTRQLLAFARKQVVCPRSMDLNEAVGGMEKMLRRLIGEDIELVWKPGADVWRVYLDPSQVDQLLANLVVNARDAIPNAGTVIVETSTAVLDEAYCGAHGGSTPGEYAVLAVSDTGVGMDRETLARIFEPFFTTKEPGKGTGLGLATVYGIVKQTGGTIYAYSEPGQGTTFRIYLPRSQGGTAAAVLREDAPKSLRGSETVLFVEDDEPILELGRSILARHGYRVLAAHTPGDALLAAEKEPGEIHLLASDVVMPGMNGRELWKRLHAQRPALKCLYLSGYTADAIAQRGVLPEGVNFLQKPYSLKGLAEKVRAVLDG